MSDALKMHDAMVALLDKLDEIEEALSGMFVLAHVHGMPYSGPQWTEEYNRCRALTGTEKGEVSEPELPDNPARDWFEAEENQDYLNSVFPNRYVAVAMDKNTKELGVVGANEDCNDLLRAYYDAFGDDDPNVYFGYVGKEPPASVASLLEDGEEV